MISSHTQNETFAQIKIIPYNIKKALVRSNLTKMIFNFL